MGRIVGLTIDYGALVALLVMVVSSWVSWFRSNIKWTKPLWRNAVAVCGFVGCTFSALLLVGLAIAAVVKGGIPFNHPVLLLAFRLGFVSSAVGMIAGFLGTGPLQNPTLGCSAFALLMWAIQGVTQ